MLNYRDPILDELLGKEVKIIFKDKTEESGILKWNDAWNFDNPIKPFSYYIECNKYGSLSFRKTYIKKIFVKDWKEVKR